MLQAPAGSDPSINNGSASVPFDTLLAFAPGSTLKLSNASLFVQNQGIALQALGGANPNDRVVFTSFADDTVSGDTNRDGAGTTPRGGDWGGIVFRNFDDSIPGRTTTQFPVDGNLQGPTGQLAVSGADDAMSIINYANVRYGGGAVPATQGVRYDAITLYNSRPAITNDSVSVPNASTSGAQAGISGDLDSFREDDLARGPLVREDERLQLQPQRHLGPPQPRQRAVRRGRGNQRHRLPGQPHDARGQQELHLRRPPALHPDLADDRRRAVAGQLRGPDELRQRPGLHPARHDVQVAARRRDRGGQRRREHQRRRPDLHQPVRRRSELHPQLPGLQVRGHRGRAGPVHLALRQHGDDLLHRPHHQHPTVIVPAIDSGNSKGTNQPTPGNVPELARWWSLGIQSGAVAVINDAEFRYGGGQLNGPDQTLPSQSVLAFITNVTALNSTFSDAGTHAIITHNNFFDNLDTAMQIEPDGLLAADPLRPLQSGNPFFRDNLMQRNDIDGMAVVTSRTYLVSADRTHVLRPSGRQPGAGGVNQTVNAVWDDTDLTYVLRGTVVLAGYSTFSGPFGGNKLPVPSTTTYGAEQTPAITLTIQSALPGTLLADGETIARPGESVLVKMLNDNALQNVGRPRPVRLDRPRGRHPRRRRLHRGRRR